MKKIIRISNYGSIRNVERKINYYFTTFNKFFGYMIMKCKISNNIRTDN